MRIVSLLPACTEWVSLFGAREGLVGRSHTCDYPNEVRELPAITQAGRNGGAEDEFRSLVGRRLSSFRLDLDLLVELRPDLILTQMQSGADVDDAFERALAEHFPRRPHVFSFRPRTLKEVLNQALALGAIIDRQSHAMKAIAGLEKRLQGLQQRLGIGRGRNTVHTRTVVMLEWTDTAVAGGYWIPDLIEHAGGRPVCVAAGEASNRLDWNVIKDEDPDVIVIAPRGRSVDEARTVARNLQECEGWEDLRAVREERVFLCDGSAYFHRPGPRLYRSIEILAAALHGDLSGVEPDPEEMAVL